MTINNFDFDCLHMKTIKLINLFDVVSCGESVECGELVPLIGNTSHNNSIIKFVNYYNFEGDYICINVVNPYIGLCSVHHGKFAVQHNIIVLHLKSKYKRLTDCLSCLACNLTQYLHLKYIKCFRINEREIINEFIPRIPFIQDLNNSHKMIIDSEGLKYCFNFWSEGNDLINKFYNPSIIGLKKINIGQVFNVVNGISDNDRKTMKPGVYPLISSSGLNNGIIDYIDKYNYDGEFISYCRSGSVGCCFVQIGKFMILNHSTGLIQLKPEYRYLSSCLTLLAYWMTQHFKQSYSYSSKLLSNDRIKSETITLPVVVKGLTHEQKQQISNKSVSINELTNNFTSDKFEYELNENLINWFCYKWFI